MKKFWCELSDYGKEPLTSKLRLDVGTYKNVPHTYNVDGHIMVAGRGKRNMLNVIISQLLSRYSPDTLSMYICDCKGSKAYEGFGHANGTIRTRHIKSICTGGTVSACLHMLDVVLAECSKRIAKMSDSLQSGEAVQNPHLVVILDGYLKVSDDPTFQDLLKRILSVSSVANVHVIFATDNLYQRDWALSFCATRLCTPCNIDTSTLLLGANMAAYSPAPTGFVWVCTDIEHPNTNTRGLCVPFCSRGNLWDDEALEKDKEAHRASQNMVSVLTTLEGMYGASSHAISIL